MKIVFIGAGNLATRLSLAMQRVGMQIGQVYSHTEASARQLATRLGCPWTNDLSALQEDGNHIKIHIPSLTECLQRIKDSETLGISFKYAHRHTSCRMDPHTVIRFNLRYYIRQDSILQ